MSFWRTHPGFHSVATFRASGAASENSGQEMAKGVAERASAVRRARHARGQLESEHTRPVSLTIREEILAEANTMDLNLSQILEEELRKRIRDARGAKWAEENREFIDSYNAYIERNGVFGEELLDLDDPPV
jgi:antitoxin CcdA